MSAHELFTPVNLGTLVLLAFTVLSLGSAMTVILSRNTVRSALFLILCFLSTAPIWLILGAEFLSLILILVYVGAVMTLFLFVVMMTDLAASKTYTKKPITLYAMGLFIGMSFMGVIIYSLYQYLIHASFPAIQNHEPAYSNTETLGRVLYTNHALAFIAAGLILLVAIVAAIALLHRPPRACKVQNVPDQLSVDSRDRIRFVTDFSHLRSPLPNQQEQIP